MPELPEVEVVRRGLEAHVLHRPVAAVEVLHPRPVRRHLAGPDDFVARLTGRTFTDARRRGKYLWLPLDTGDALLGHLGMSGQLLVQSVGHPDERHLRVRFDLGVPEYVIEDEGPDHMKTFTARVRVADRLHGRGVGRSKKEAEQQAAESAYRTLSREYGDPTATASANGRGA